MVALVPLAIAIAPEIASWLSGNDADKVTTAISQAIEAVTGTSDPEAATSALQNDPVAASKLRLQLAQIAAGEEKASRAADLDQLAATLRDEAATRAQAPTGQKTTASWAAAVISAVVLLTFGSVMVLVLRYGMPAGAETAANMLLGTLAAMATSVVSYWVGSSAGSARKDERLFQAGK